ncbi:LD-carboxypeptidase [Kitasatospora viridis]|uniref:Muramoyltetrapeptide carboxypeptidase LdcA involved in peptidoglycan recycling n=1 Tax=Kitasatospora viridis TaxID=281105 RepID=A0A561UHW2_9ACTN|nr:LD-carboxypeptidase [Kitasatospora viridis]TWF98946.1 muramoyltetrapeptide carboxypeptidase LdcA involved in peptidoglycan recycling [Kitasatospora viridis]
MSASPGASHLEQVAAAWTAAFDGVRHPDSANFFDLGGTSQQLLRVVAELRELPAGGQVTAQDLYRHPTIRALADALAARTGPAAGPDGPTGPRTPAAVGPGDTIRIVSPGFPTLAHLPDRAGRAVAALEALGFAVGFGEHAFAMSPDGLTAGPARQRAADIMAAFEDPGVDAILVSDAGEGSRELLPLLDARVIARNPKPFVGFCDTAFLQHYLALEAGLGSAYGCSLMVHLGDVGGPMPETTDHLVRTLAGLPLELRPVASRSRPLTTWFDPDVEGSRRVRDVPGGWHWARGGVASGPLFGGEVSQLADIVKEFGLSYDGAVVFVDITEEHTTPPLWLLGRLFREVDLTGAAALVIGADPQSDPAVWARQVSALLDRFVPGTSFPVLVNADICHLAPCWTVPFGEPAVLDESRGLLFPRRAHPVTSSTSRSADV